MQLICWPIEVARLGISRWIVQDSPEGNLRGAASRVAGQDSNPRPLGYEANGTRPTPLIRSCGVQSGQGRSSMASHLVQPARPQPAASLLLFLLRSPEDRRGQQCLPSLGGGRRDATPSTQPNRWLCSVRSGLRLPGHDPQRCSLCVRVVRAHRSLVMCFGLRMVGFHGASLLAVF
jgi:hypothetical protein